MSGLSRTPGKRVWVNSPPRVRIPPAPPEPQNLLAHNRFFFGSSLASTPLEFDNQAAEESNKPVVGASLRSVVLRLASISRDDSPLEWRPVLRPGHAG